MKKFTFFIISLFITTLLITAAERKISWEGVEDPLLSHYVVAWGKVSRGTDQHPDTFQYAYTEKTSQTEFMVSGLDYEGVWYISVYAVNQNGEKSCYAEEILHNKPEKLVLDAIDDFTIRKNKSATGGEELMLKSTRGGDHREAFLKFDISSIQRQPIKTTLRLYCTSPVAEVSLYQVKNDNWSRDTVDWKSRPEFDENILGTAITHRNQYIEWDVSTAIASQAEGDSIVSFRIHDAEFTNKVTKFVSKDSISNKPQLVLTIPRAIPE